MQQRNLLTEFKAPPSPTTVRELQLAFHTFLAVNAFQVDAVKTVTSWQAHLRAETLFKLGSTPYLYDKSGQLVRPSTIPSNPQQDDPETGSHSIVQQDIKVTRAIYSVGSSSDASRIWRPARQRKSGNHQQLQRPHMQSKMSLTRKILRSHSELEPCAEMFCRGLAQILLGCSGTGWTAHVSCCSATEICKRRLDPRRSQEWRLARPHRWDQMKGSSSHLQTGNCCQELQTDLPEHRAAVLQNNWFQFVADRLASMDLAHKLNTTWVRNRRWKISLPFTPKVNFNCF